jgi:hypothetical protein
MPGARPVLGIHASGHPGSEAPSPAKYELSDMSEKKKFLLRLDEDLFNALQKWASDELRSINAQIEFLLTDSARKAGRLKKTRPPQDADDGRSGG